MADADWEIVQKYVYVKDPYATRKVERDLDQLTGIAPVTCPKCLAQENQNEDPTPSEWREMMHESRLRLLKAEKVRYSYMTSMTSSLCTNFFACYNACL